mgnify:CR=1 FL=1
MTILKSLTFDDVLLVPNYGNKSRDDGSVETALGPYKFSIPIIASNMDTICGVDMAVAMAKLGGLGILHRFMFIEENVLAYKTACGFHKGYVVGVSVGVNEGEMTRAAALYDAGARLFCVDIAHAHCKQMGKMIKALKTVYSDIYVIAGNICTYSGADYLVGVGADAVKVGVGAGSVCTTREVTGFGVPQLTAIMDCARIDRPIIADGGIRKSGDVVKALAAGAMMVMLGSMLAGTDEACDTAGRYRGMASAEARKDYYGTESGWRAAEGISIDVEPKGPVANVIAEIVGGIKSGLSYAGARTLSELRRKASFVEISHATYIEGMPHGLS